MKTFFISVTAIITMMSASAFADESCEKQLAKAQDKTIALQDKLLQLSQKPKIDYIVRSARSAKIACDRAQQQCAANRGKALSMNYNSETVPASTYFYEYETSTCLVACKLPASSQQ